MSGLSGAGIEGPGAGVARPARGMLNVGIRWPVCFGLVVDCPGQSWGWVGSVVLDAMVAAVEMEVGLALRQW